MIDKEPDGIVEENNNPTLQRANSLKRIEQSYEYMLLGLHDANEDDLILLSDNDEIPNLGFSLSNKKILKTGFKFLYALDECIKEMIEKWSKNWSVAFRI